MAKFVYCDARLPSAFWDRVEISDLGCWAWTGTLNHGYGILPRSITIGRLIRSHRVSYEAFIGPIPEGMQIDHLCRNRACCNPAHLEAVTSGENTRRGLAGWHNKVKAMARSRCPNGHEYTPENTYISGRNGVRNCRECRRDAQRRFVAKQKEAALG